jgi:hypothetical protein
VFENPGLESRLQPLEQENRLKAELQTCAGAATAVSPTGSVIPWSLPAKLRVKEASAISVMCAVKPVPSAHPRTAFKPNTKVASLRRFQPNSAQFGDGCRITRTVPFR